MTTTSKGDHGSPGGAPTRHWALVGIAVIGLAYAVMPLAFDMFDRTPKGAVMIADFEPYMTSARLSGYLAYSP
jgi:hypothetical protein